MIVQVTDAQFEEIKTKLSHTSSATLTFDADVLTLRSGKKSLDLTIKSRGFDYVKRNSLLLVVGLHPKGKR